jgi:hypothetical protein
MASTLMLSSPRSRTHGNQSRFPTVAALFIAVLVAEAVALALLAANIPDITTLYITTT